MQLQAHGRPWNEPRGHADRGERRDADILVGPQHITRTCASPVECGGQGGNVAEQLPQGVKMRFYTLQHTVGVPDETTYVQAGRVVRGAPPICPSCGSIAGALSWQPPRRAVVVRYGKDFGDVAYGDAEELLISARFRLAWEGAGLQGISEFAELEEVRFRPRPKSPLQYCYCRVAQRGRVQVLQGATRPDSGATGDPCGLCGNGRGILDAVGAFEIDNGSWDGSDIFVPWNLGSVVVTQPFVDWASENHLTNVHPIAAEDHWFDPLNLLPRNSPGPAEPRRG